MTILNHLNDGVVVGPDPDDDAVRIVLLDVADNLRRQFAGVLQNVDVPAALVRIAEHAS